MFTPFMPATCNMYNCDSFHVNFALVTEHVYVDIRIAPSFAEVGTPLLPGQI